MTQSVISVFDELVRLQPPTAGPVLFETACVLGGSVAGLMAARVLADHARRVVVLERDEVALAGRSRLGTPQDRQVHTLLPAGSRWIERWLPGFTREAQELGAILSGTAITRTTIDGHPQARSSVDFELLLAGRPLLEAHLRARVAALPNVTIRRGRATTLEFSNGAVGAVGYVDGKAEGLFETDFVVDAMGRSSRLSDWVSEQGYDEPRLERIAVPINYSTALFERTTKAADLEIACALAGLTPGHVIDGVSGAAVNAIEDEQWIVMLMGYGDDRPARTVEAFRATCAKLPAIFGEATGGAVTRDVATYRQADSRRRHFEQLSHFPARLVSVGDAVASFNPLYGQGMSSAALHASCLSSYLTGGPDLTTAATQFFRLQQVVVDAAWAVSAGADSARRDAETGAFVPEEVRQRRWALQQVIGATLVDPNITRTFKEVSYMLRHPAVLADPALLARAIAADPGH